MRLPTIILVAALQKFTTATSPNLQQQQQGDILDNVNSTSIRAFLQELTREPHLAGSDADLRLAQWIESNFRDFGLDHTQQDSYRLLLSYPDPADPNTVRLLDETGAVRFTSRHKEEVLRPEDDHPNFVDAFLAFTPAGTVSGEAVYVNYGREEDLDRLESEFGVSLEGKIAIARYGFGFRGNKIRSCEERGAIGVVIFTDPNDVTLGGQQDEDAVYPYTQFLPESGIQRGGTKTWVEGDPLTPGWPSIDNAYRLPLEERKGLPGIPAQPIGYGDAKILMESLGGPLAPQDWTGGLQDVTYHIGGEFSSSHADWKMELSTHNTFNDSTNNVNVVGLIKGSEEPDRYVIVCNHRDAWGYGATDPSGGTAVLLEMARVLGEQVRSGLWRPKRSIVFASWAAEEYGLLGSTEWVFHKMPKLTDRAVAVINVDSAAWGTFLSSKASPSLGHLSVEAAKLVADPQDESQSYYDYWKQRLNLDQPFPEVEPSSRLIASGSDHDPFVYIAGVPAIALTLVADTVDYPGIFTNPTYHTGFETFYLVDEILDPGFRYHRLCAQIATAVAMDLADRDLLNFNFHGLTDLMSDSLSVMETDGTSTFLEQNGATLQFLREAVVELDSSITDFESYAQVQDLEDPLARRRINDQIMRLERIFVSGSGLPGRTDARHLIYSPSKFNKYGSAAFPGLSDLLDELSRMDPSDEAMRLQHWEKIKRHVSDLMIAVRQAASYLQPAEFI